MEKPKKTARPALFSYAMVAPAVLLFTVFAVYPFLKGFSISFFKWDGLSPMQWAGLRNYKNIFTDTEYWAALKNTFHYALFTTVAKNILGFFLAVLMLRLRVCKGFFRTISYMPVTFSYVVCGMLWAWIFNPTFGLLNQFLRAVGAQALILGWLSDAGVALYSVMLVDVWRWAGFHMVLYLAGLQAIPKDYYEAAEIDGAGPLKKFWRITVPQLNGVIVLNILMSVTGALIANYDIVSVMTGGGPYGSTEVALTYIYRTGFSFYNMGKASAMSMILFAITLVFGLVQILSMTRDQNYDS